MRRDSELFLKKILKYRIDTQEDAFELHFNFFSDIPNIKTEIEDIFAELQKEQCISRKSRILDETIKIYLTLDGITYFESKLDGDNSPSMIFNVNGGQVNVAQGKGTIEAGQYENGDKNGTKVIIIKDSPDKIRTSKSTSSKDTGNEMLGVGIVILLILTKEYLNYRMQVQLGLVISSIVVEAITCMVYYSGKKSGIIYGKNIKEISYFNIISIAIVPVIIGIINIPIYNSKVNIDILMKSIGRQNWISVFWESEYSFYAISQMVGMVFLLWLMLFIIRSDIYIIAIINIVREKRAQWLWKRLLKLTYVRHKNWEGHVKKGLGIMVISILFASGIFAYFIHFMQNIKLPT